MSHDFRSEVLEQPGARVLELSDARPEKIHFNRGIIKNLALAVLNDREPRFDIVAQGEDPKWRDLRWGSAAVTYGRGKEHFHARNGNGHGFAQSIRMRSEADLNARIDELAQVFHDEKTIAEIKEQLRFGKSASCELPEPVPFPEIDGSKTGPMVTGVAVDLNDMGVLISRLAPATWQVGRNWGNYGIVGYPDKAEARYTDQREPGRALSEPVDSHLFIGKDELHVWQEFVEKCVPDEKTREMALDVLDHMLWN